MRTWQVSTAGFGIHTGYEFGWGPEDMRAGGLFIGILPFPEVFSKESRYIPERKLSWHFGSKGQFS
jgi:hypothetical protein